jgi:hypothetical protein
MFGDINHLFTKASEVVSYLENQISQSSLESFFLKLDKVRDVLHRYSLAQHDFWKEKAQLHWLREGDANT